MKILILLVLLVSLNSVFSIESKEVLRARLAVRKNMLRGENREVRVGDKSEKTLSYDPKVELLSLKEKGVSCNDPKQTDYRGRISVTSKGYVCQKWSEQFPQTHDQTPEKNQFAGLERNYCRNPTPETHNRAWCYTTDLETRWDYCDVNCNQPDPIHKPSKCVDKYQRDYRGKIAHTKSGKLCQRWDVQYPHENTFNHPDQRIFAGLKHNYCRNPGMGKSGAWCYTTDPKVEWELCDVECDPLEVVAENHVQCTHPRQVDYRGHVSVTKSGRVCQDWAAQSPQSHGFNATAFPDDGLTHNYCRNPLATSLLYTGAWCFTTDPNMRWEYCDVDCNKVEVKPHPTLCLTPTQKDYRGKTSVTKSGKTCQRWDVQYPHKHIHTPHAYPLSGLKENNYCRNPGNGKSRAWCYTTDAKTEWEFCDVDCLTHSSSTPIVIEPTCADPKQSDYRGSVSYTKSGRTCQRWDEQSPHKHTNTPILKPESGLNENNYCRNPDNSERAWCYTTDPKVRFEFCDIDCTKPSTPAVEERVALPKGVLSHCVDRKQRDYRGAVSKTINGRECQRWDAQTPHKHTNTPTLKPRAGLAGNNYCRNPDGSINGTWCYTTDPKVRWEYCATDCVADEVGPTSPTVIPQPTVTIPGFVIPNITLPLFPQQQQFNFNETEFDRARNATESEVNEMQEAIENYMKRHEMKLQDAIEQYQQIMSHFSAAVKEKKEMRMQKYLAAIKDISAMMAHLEDMQNEAILKSDAKNNKKLAHLLEKCKNDVNQHKDQNNDTVKEWKHSMKDALNKLEELDETSLNALKQETKVVNVNLDKVMKFIKEKANKESKFMKRFAADVNYEFPKTSRLLKYFHPDVFTPAPTVCVDVVPVTHERPSFLQKEISKPLSKSADSAFIVSNVFNKLKGKK